MKGILFFALIILPLIQGCGSTSNDDGGNAANQPAPSPSPSPQPQAATCTLTFGFPNTPSSVVDVGQTFSARIVTNLPSNTTDVKACLGGTKIAQGQFDAIQDSPDTNCQEWAMNDPSQPLDLSFTALEGQQGSYTRYCVLKQNGNILTTTKNTPQKITIRSPLNAGKFWVDQVTTGGIDLPTASQILIAYGTFNTSATGFLLRCGTAQLSSTEVFFSSNVAVSMRVGLNFIQPYIGNSPCTLILNSGTGSTLYDFSNGVSFNP